MNAINESSRFLTLYLRLYLHTIALSENRANTRWTIVQSMADAKTALKVLFEMTASDRKKNYMQSQEMDELMVTKHFYVNLQYMKNS